MNPTLLLPLVLAAPPAVLVPLSPGVPDAVFAEPTHIYDLSGRIVRQQLSSDVSGSFHWDGRGDAGQPLPSGVYLAAAGAPGPGAQSEAWTRCSPDPLLPLGQPGCFDAAEVYAPSVLVEGDTTKIWYTGFDGAFAGGPTRIGFAWSTDAGASWQRDCEPVLSERGSGFDAVHVEAPFVLRDAAGDLVLYYAGFDGARLRIGRAISMDGGRSWTRSPSVPVLSGQTAWSDDVGYKTVTYCEGAYTMWFVGLRDGEVQPWKIGRAVSDDGIFWTTSPAAPVFVGIEEWESYGTTTLDVDWVDDEWVMWYAGTGGDPVRIGNARSADGISWRRNHANPVLGLGPREDWDGRDVNEPAALYDETLLTLYHSGRDTMMVNTIGCKSQPATGIGQPATFSPGPAALRPAAPNPFNPRTTLRFSMASSGNARLAIHDLSGRLVRTLVAGSLPPGEHEAVWEGRNENGRTVASGVYLAVFETNELRETRRLLLLK